MDIQKSGLFIKKKRKELGYSQMQLARRLYVEPQTVSKWERGLGMPDYDNIIELAKIFECDVKDIIAPPDITEDEVTALTIVDESEEIDTPDLPMLASVLSSNEEKEQGKKFKASDFFKKKKLRDRISKIFGYEYENVYNEKFLFKNIFKKRTRRDYENTLSQGMFRDKLNHTTIGIEAPWLYMRVLIFMAICTVIAFTVSAINSTPIYAIVFGSLLSVVPLLVFLFESNFSRDISIFDVVKIFMLGGISSILLTLLLHLIFFSVPEVINIVAIAPIIEEIAKYAIAVAFVAKLKPKNILSGLLIGFAVGGGFDVFENMQYGLMYFLEELVASGDMTSAMASANSVILTRTGLNFLSGHHYYTAISTGIYVLFKKDSKFRIKEVFNWKAMLALLFSISLHMMWNGAGFIPNLFATLSLMTLVDVLCVASLIMLINIGIAETKVMAIYEDALEREKERAEHPDTTPFDSEPEIK